MYIFEILASIDIVIGQTLQINVTKLCMVCMYGMYVWYVCTVQLYFKFSVIQFSLINMSRNFFCLED